MVEAVEPFKLHITSMSYLYEVFEPLQLLCIDIWMHTHSITTTDVPPDLVELAKSLGDELLPWVCRTKPIHCKRFGSLKQCWSHVLDTLDTWQLTDNIMSMKEWSYHRQYAHLDRGGRNSVGEQFDYQLVALDHPFHVPPLLIFILHWHCTLPVAVPWLPYPFDDRWAHLEYMKDECTKKRKMVRKIIHLCKIR